MNNFIKIIGLAAIFILLSALVIMQVISLGAVNTLQNSIKDIDSRVEQIESDLDNQQATVTPTEEPSDADNAEMKTVKLFYKNYDADPDVMDCSAEDFVLRQVENDDDLIINTAKLLLTNQLTASEINSGLTADYLDPDYAARKAEFEIESITIENGVATVTLNDPMDFTSGGSCRSGILSSALANTLTQFEEIDSVVFLPVDQVFQP